MLSTRVRDWLAVVEVVGNYFSQEQIAHEIARLYRIAGESTTRPQPFDLEQQRSERDDLAGAR